MDSVDFDVQCAIGRVTSVVLAEGSCVSDNTCPAGVGSVRFEVPAGGYSVGFGQVARLPMLGTVLKKVFRA